MCAVQGLAMQRFLQMMADRESPAAVDFEWVLVAGHFLMRDENLFTFFEGLSLKPPDSHGELESFLCSVQFYHPALGI